jgi:ABC-type nitrate/sulfonate/bicarbonate transport system ATPase subunit
MLFKQVSDAAASVRALQNIDLDVWPGEFVSLIGPSGCGKSTLLRATSDLLVPTSGDAQLPRREGG